MNKTKKIAALAIILLGAGLIYSYGGFSVARIREALSTPAVIRKLNLDLQRDFGLNQAQAAGVIANLSFESGGFQQFQEITPLISGSRGGFGYAQWTGPRRRDFEAWVSARDLSPYSYEANYGFLKHELANTAERRVIAKLKGAQSAVYAAQIFSETFLRPGIPHLRKRQELAARIYKTISNEGVA